MQLSYGRLQRQAVAHPSMAARPLHAVRLRATSSAPASHSTAAPTQKQTIFTKLGGAPAVRAAVDIFYDKMMADDRVSYFFEGVDMKAQRAHQAAFLNFALGGAEKYEGNANMTSAHSRLVKQYGLRMDHFDIVLEHLGGALTDLNVPEEDIGEAAAVVETLRPAFQLAIDEAEQD